MSASESIFRKRLRKFRRLKRGYYSFLIVVGAYLLSFALPLIANSKALVVCYEGRFYFPIAAYHGATEFGMQAIGEADYRDLKKQFATQGAGNWVLMPFYPYGPNEALLEDAVAFHGVSKYPARVKCALLGWMAYKDAAAAAIARKA